MQPWIIDEELSSNIIVISCGKGNFYWLQEPHACSSSQIEWSLVVPEFGDIPHSLVHAELQTLCCTITNACIAGYAPTLVDGKSRSAYKDLNLNFLKTGLPCVSKEIPDKDKEPDKEQLALKMAWTFWWGSWAVKNESLAQDMALRLLCHQIHFCVMTVWKWKWLCPHHQDNLVLKGQFMQIIKKKHIL